MNSTASYRQSMSECLGSRTEMLASAMMLVSISETATVNIGYKSMSPSSFSREGDTPTGWGSPTTRKSYKMDLASLAAASSSDLPLPPLSMAHCGARSEVHDEGWGFFDDAVSSS